MKVGESFRVATTDARYEVEEVSEDRTRAIVRSPRTGGRVMLFAQPGRVFYARSVVDNGQPGVSLFASLEPTGPRIEMIREPEVVAANEYL
jgi:hypothetical protein